MHTVGIDFDGATQTVLVDANDRQGPISAEASITVFNDGVSEGEEGFIVLFRVEGSELEREDAGYVDIVRAAFAVVLLDGGK